MYSRTYWVVLMVSKMPEIIFNTLLLVYGKTAKKYAWYRRGEKYVIDIKVLVNLEYTNSFDGIESEHVVYEIQDGTKFYTLLSKMLKEDLDAGFIVKEEIQKVLDESKLKEWGYVI